MAPIVVCVVMREMALRLRMIRPISNSQTSSILMGDVL